MQETVEVLWRALNAVLAGACLIWLVTVFRERHRRRDRVYGDFLALGAICLSTASVVGAIWQFTGSRHPYITPATPFATLGFVCILISSYLTISRKGERK